MESASPPRAPTRNERDALLAWLDQGLREGRRGRLEAEYPLSLTPERRGDHRTIYAGAVPLAHAMLHEVTLRSRGARLRLGLIGLVYTAEPARGRGLARRCVASCLEELARRGVPLALLWSDRHDFYRRLGFERAGFEEQLRVDAVRCRRARRNGSAAPAALRVEPAASADFAALESIYRAKPVGGERPPGALARLAAAPDTELVVARRNGRPLAYAALGRGDDFGGVVHEWAAADGGDEGAATDALLACWESLCIRHGELAVLAGPLREPATERLHAVDAPRHAGCFALARILDPAGLWHALDLPRHGVVLAGDADAPLLRGSRGELRLTRAEALALLFGPSLPLRLCAWLDRGERAALADHLPFPLYLWGFDSI